MAGRLKAHSLHRRVRRFGCVSIATSWACGMNGHLSRLPENINATFAWIVDDLELSCLYQRRTLRVSLGCPTVTNERKQNERTK